MLVNKLKQLVGTTSKPAVYCIEKSQIVRFVKAIGETHAMYQDEEAARAAGFKTLVAPPSFVEVLHRYDIFFELLGIPQEIWMHAEESCVYMRPLCAGDTVYVTHRVVDAYTQEASKGFLQFLVIETTGTSHLKSGKGQDDILYQNKRVFVSLKQ